MSKEIKGDHKHLTLSDRVYIEQALTRGDNFRTIAKVLGKDPSTISLEVRRFIEWNDGYYARQSGNDCAHYASCDLYGLCNRIGWIFLHPFTPPYVPFGIRRFKSTSTRAFRRNNRTD